MKVKKLVKPIKTIINFHIRTWWDKTNGNSYFSAQAIVNHDYDNILYLPFEYGYGSYPEQRCIEELVKQWPSLKNVKELGRHDLLINGIYLTVDKKEAKQNECKRWGKP